MQRGSAPGGDLREIALPRVEGWRQRHLPSVLRAPGGQVRFGDMAGRGALDGLRIIEHGGWSGAFAGRLLTEAGAEVVRVTAPGGDFLAAEPPFFAGSTVSIQDTWYNAGKQVVETVTKEERREALRTLIPAADIVVEDCQSGDEVFGEDELRALNPGLVYLHVSPMGTGGPWKRCRVNDLVANALCGSASVTGNQETPPITGYGNQTYHTVGLYAALCALAALHSRRRTGEAQLVHLNAHEALASCTEQVLMEWFFPDGPWQTPIAPRQGSLHWSRAYEVYSGKTGRGIMVTVALRLFDSLLPWLEEEGAAQELADRDKYPDPAAMIQELPYMMQVMREWVATKDADELFYEGQKRHQPFGVVWDVATAVQSPQIEARGYFQEQEVPGAGTVWFPGRMFRTSADGPRVEPPRRIQVRDLAWDARPAPQQTGTGAASAPSRPLEGVRVLDFTHVLAGPFGTRVMADLGADVIKVSTAARGTGANSPSHPYYVSWNRNKRSITLDMASAEGLAIARELALQSDIIIENFRAGVLARWGLDREGLQDDHPGITVIAMGGMGQTGPWKDYVTFAPTIHALTGLTYLTNPPGRHDLGYGFSLTDHLSGLAGALAACEALEHRRRTGEGLAIDLAQYELGLSIMAPVYMDYFSNGRNPEPTGNRHPWDAWAPHGIYRAAGDDHWVAIAVRGDDEWQRLAMVMGDQGLAHDPRFVTHQHRVANASTLDTLIESWTCRRDRYDVMEACQASGIAAGAVQNAADLSVNDPQMRAHGFFGTVTGGVRGEYGVDRFPASFQGERPQHYEGVHGVGEDTFAVLAEVLGLDPERIAGLAESGALT